MPDINDILGIKNPPEQPNTKRKIVEDLLTNLVFSLGQGYSAQGATRGPQARAAGIGAAIQGPMVLQQIRQQQENERQDRAIKIQQLRQAALRGDQEQVLRLRDALQGSEAPAITVPAAPVMPSDAGGGGAGLQPEGTRQVPMPLPTLQYPMASGQNIPLTSTSGQQAREMGLNLARQQAQIKSEFERPQLDTAPFGYDNTGLYEKTTGRVIRPPEKPPTPKVTYTQENVTVDGQPTVALRPSDGSRYVDVNTHQPITGKIGVLKNEASDPSGTIQYQDDSGKWIWGVADRKTNTITPLKVAGTGQTATATASKLTGMAANRATASKSLQDLIPDIIGQINANRSKLGAAVGKGEDFLLKAGIRDPELRTLQSSLQSLAPLLGTLHGGRNTQYMMQEFNKSVARLGEDPDNAIAALKAQLSIAQTIQNAQDEVLGANAPPITPPTGNQRIEQFSPSTKQYRYSLDGGKTWASGRLPQK